MDKQTAAKNDYMMKTKMFGVKTVHFAVTIVLFFIMFIFFRYGKLTGIIDVGFRYNYLVAFGFAIITGFFNRTYNSYLFGYCRIGTLAFSQFLSQFFALFMIYFAVSLGWSQWKAPWLLKRLFDATMAATGLVIFSPVLLITALAIKLDDRGPVFYKQTRLTRDGKKFHATMLQSMSKRLDFA